MIIPPGYKENHIIFKLDDVMKEKGFNKNQLCVKAGLRFETVQGFYLGTISRIDINVLSRICKILDCSIDDLIEYAEE